MTTKPRFTVKVILVCTVLSMPLAVMAAFFPLADAVVLVLAAAGFIAFLTARRKGIRQALVEAGIILLIVIGWAALVWILAWAS